MEINTQVKMEGYPQSPRKSAKQVILVEASLRILAFAASLAATLLMALSTETVNIFGITLEAKYSYSSTFVFFLVGNAVASAYALLSIPFAFIIHYKALGRASRFLLFFFDLMVMGMVVAAASAATAIGHLGKKGNQHVGWAPTCGQIRNFCDRIENSISCSFAAAVLYFLIALVSASASKATVFSRRQ